ncbi:MAG: CRISPR-associated endonuclease Cas2 [Halanaerobiales bacterium]|nr:CRISPR-associated endonuclease Cas2 [Halanaerobiales bacterium]
MYVIMVYDFNEKRVGKALKISRKYLNWVQNSVFEGEITKAKLTKLKMEMEKLMNEDEDSVIFYQLRSKSYYSRDIMGIGKSIGDNFL